MNPDCASSLYWYFLAASVTVSSRSICFALYKVFCGQIGAKTSRIHVKRSHDDFVYPKSATTSQKAHMHIVSVPITQVHQYGKHIEDAIAKRNIRPRPSNMLVMVSTASQYDYHLWLCSSPRFLQESALWQEWDRTWTWLGTFSIVQLYFILRLSEEQSKWMEMFWYPNTYSPGSGGNIEPSGAMKMWFVC